MSARYHLIAAVMVSPGERADTLPQGDAIAVRRIGSCVLIEVFVSGGQGAEDDDAPQPRHAAAVAEAVTPRKESVRSPAGNVVRSSPIPAPDPRGKDSFFTHVREWGDARPTSREQRTF
jgi:hypothetical protein